MLFLEHAVIPLDPKMDIPADLPHYGVPELQIDDLDDTLSRTSQALGGLLRISTDLELGDKINDDVMQRARVRAWERGGSYNVLNLLSTQLDEETAANVRKRFRDGEGAHPMAFEDAVTYQSRLRAVGHAPHFIMTYGENVNEFPDGGWQRDKIERARSQGWWPTGFAYFMPHTRKGPVVDGLRSPVTGNFDLIGIDDKGRPAAVFTADHALMIDDRKISLADLPKNCTPVYIRRPEEPATPKQTEGELPEGALTIRSLEDIPIRDSIWPMNTAARQTPHEALTIAAFVPFSLLNRYVDWNAQR